MYLLKLKSFLISILKFILRLFSLAFLLIIIIVISSSLLQLFDNYESYQLILSIVDFETGITSFVKNTFPTTIRGLDLTKILLVIISFILKLLGDLMQSKIEERKTYYTKKKSQIKKSKLEHKYQELNPISAVITKIKKIFFYKKSKLNKLQKKLTDIQNKIDSLAEELSFVSVEIVDANKMKKGIHPSKSEDNFSKFKNYIETKFQNYNVEQYTWKSDTLFAYFNKFEDAFKSCKESITGLVYFNNEVNSLDHDFDISCGINSGFIYYDDIDDIETMSDFSIEIAHKLQNHAPPNAIYVTGNSIKPLTLHKNFDPISKDIYGNIILSWYPKLRLKELQKTLTATKKKIRKMAKKMVFLSIDVVDSTKMKEGMNSADIEDAFDQYKSYVAKKFKDNKVIKTTWTPDGVMGCFGNFKNAFDTAKQIIEGLPDFNREHNLPEFQVRCGINTGLIYYDEVRPLEEMSDHSIDVAGHLQKKAEPNTINVTEQSIEPKELYDSFKSTPQLIDNYGVLTWSPPYLI